MRDVFPEDINPSQVILYFLTFIRRLMLNSILFKVCRMGEGVMTGLICPDNSSTNYLNIFSWTKNRGNIRT